MQNATAHSGLEPRDAAPRAGYNGHEPNDAPRQRQELIDYIKLKLTIAGGETRYNAGESLTIPYEVIAHLKERTRLSFGEPSPIDKRVQAFLDRLFQDLPQDQRVRVPGLGETFILDRPGMATELSFPEDGDRFNSDIVKSYRLVGDQGVLHNPKSDRRTTQGVFHVTEGGHPIPDDKRAVPVPVFARLLKRALHPPAEMNQLPFTANTPSHVFSLVSLMLRPMVVPAVDRVTPQRSYEVRFIAPGNLVSNLDFVERIFGNAGDPHLPDNDAALDTDHWTGHTGYIVLAPHLITLTKKELGLPHISEATERQKRDKMCWTNEDERYNNGDAFKLTARDEHGVVVTIIADNYFGYCKKEVKTQISFAANLLGAVEEEHAGGALVFPQFDLGKSFSVATHLPKTPHTLAEMKELFPAEIEFLPEGYGIDRQYPDVIYVPKDVEIDLNRQDVRWKTDGAVQTLPLDPTKTYIVPSGFKIRLEREEDSGQWRLVGTTAEGTFCHKPSTVSGGGKSEISKEISNAILHGPFYVASFDRDMDAVQALLDHDYTGRFRDGRKAESRPILSSHRSLGSVIKLLTPSETLYTDEYNAWLESIPHAIRELAYTVKRFYREEMGDDWRSHFSVDVVNGRPGNVLKFNGERLVSHYLRVGFEEDGSWRIFSLRSDFYPAMKLHREDDITVSMVVPERLLANLNPKYAGPVSRKLVSDENPERRFFQRPDEAIHRGYDKATEAHFAWSGNFFSNLEPLERSEAEAMLNTAISLSEFTEPMQSVVRRAAQLEGYFVSSAHPRIFEGKPSKNPRFLQIRPDLIDRKPGYLAEIGVRLHRQAAFREPVYNPVSATLPGRRLNPPDAAAGIRSLAVYNPVHYQETPELFMELISSLTGKSPSTTGAGSEGALTKGPFNALLPIIDVNNALVAHILTGSECFVTAAGHVGPKFRVDHDISILIPEIWSRMEVSERDPKFLIENGFLEKCEDFEHEGRTVYASRLGYRINEHFMRTFFGIVFDNPNDVFTPEMLRPERQGIEDFVDGVDNIVTTQKSIAELYFADGSVDIACPPLKALLHIMRDGHYEGKAIDDPAIRALFDRDALLASDWYRERLEAQKAMDVRAWALHVAYLEDFLSTSPQLRDSLRREIMVRLNRANGMVERASGEGYVDGLTGFIGADPSVPRALGLL